MSDALPPVKITVTARSGYHPAAVEEALGLLGGVLRVEQVFPDHADEKRTRLWEIDADADLSEHLLFVLQSHAMFERVQAAPSRSL